MFGFHNIPRNHETLSNERCHEVMGHLCERAYQCVLRCSNIDEVRHEGIVVAGIAEIVLCEVVYHDQFVVFI